jgi:hypothetical protein
MAVSTSMRQEHNRFFSRRYGAWEKLGPFPTAGAKDFKGLARHRRALFLSRPRFDLTFLGGSERKPM